MTGCLFQTKSDLAVPMSKKEKLVPIIEKNESADLADLLSERDALNRCLLAATAKLAQGQDPDTILKSICDALVSATPHIRLAWMYLGDPDAPMVRPHYAVGPAKDFAEGLAIGKGEQDMLTPTRRSLVTAKAIITSVKAEREDAPWRKYALQYGFEATARLPFGSPGDAVMGMVALYVDSEDYFERMGGDPFLAFAQLGQVSLEQARLRQRLERLATLDPLTGLLNRSALQEAIEREHGRAKRRGRNYSLLLFDIDRFKIINDNLGHQIGDKVLVDVALTAQRALRTGDWLGRWGGEEFLCLLPEAGIQEAALVAERLRRMVEQTPIAVNGSEISVTVSAGVTSYPTDGEGLDLLLNNVDSVLYQAKRSGRNRVIVSDGSAPGLFSIVGQLEMALRSNRVRAAYQPIYDLHSGERVAEEALARLITEDGDIVDAGSFIEPASQLQVVHRIDEQMMRQALQRCTECVIAGNTITHFVNISADLLRHPKLVEDLLSWARKRCAECGDRVGKEKPLVIEITEREFIGEPQEAKRILAPFLDFGFRLAIDDFGSGYSSFKYLADLPIDFLKIEGSLVLRVAQDQRIRAIIQGIHDTASNLGLITLAECVEDAATVDVLRQIGVNWAQGHYFGRPLLDSNS